ncbi:MAG: hypothetical protein ACI3VJ_04690 [Hominicoprocola sp.]
MQYVYPDYYPKFHCLAQRCRHSCCIGWEIEYSQENLGARFDALC